MSKYDEMRKKLRYAITDLHEGRYTLSQFMNLFDDIFIKYRKEIEKPKIGGWIPCSERLPEEDGFYLVTLTEKVTDINDIRVTKVFFSEKSNGFTGYGKSVIAWQPLPEAYHE